MDDQAGWRTEISKRVDALERVQDALWNMLRDVLGKTETGEPRLGNIGVGTIVAFLAGVVTPIIVAVILAKPWA